MKRVYFGTMKELAEFMFTEAVGGHSAITALFYDEAKELMRELLKYDEVDAYGIEIHPEEWEGYNKEYYITLSDDLTLFVEQAYQKDKDRYLSFEHDCLILGSGVNSKIALKNEAEHAPVYEAVFEGDEDFDCSDCELCACDCEHCEDNDDAVIHFEINMNGSHYNGTTTLGKFLSSFLE